MDLLDQPRDSLTKTWPFKTAVMSAVKAALGHCGALLIAAKSPSNQRKKSGHY
jgi:hypothetical protein